MLKHFKNIINLVKNYNFWMTESSYNLLCICRFVQITRINVDVHADVPIYNMRVFVSSSLTFIIMTALSFSLLSDHSIPRNGRLVT